MGHERYEIARGLAALFYPQFALPKTQPIEDKEPKVTSLIRRVLLQFSKGKADAELFTPEAQKKILSGDNAKQISEGLNSLSLPVAVIYTNELIERREENGFRTYRYLLNDVTRTLSSTDILLSDSHQRHFCRFQFAKRHLCWRKDLPGK